MVPPARPGPKQPVESGRLLGNAGGLTVSQLDLPGAGAGGGAPRGWAQRMAASSGQVSEVERNVLTSPLPPSPHHWTKQTRPPDSARPRDPLWVGTPLPINTSRPAFCPLFSPPPPLSQREGGAVHFLNQGRDFSGQRSHVILFSRFCPRAHLSSCSDPGTWAGPQPLGSGVWVG